MAVGRWVLVFGILILIVSASVLDVTVLSIFSSDDKVAHVLGYAVFALSVRSVVRLGYAVVGLVLLGGSLEIVQAFVPGRMMDVGDFGANGIGIAVGLGIAGMLGLGIEGRDPRSRGQR